MMKPAMVRGRETSGTIIQPANPNLHSAHVSRLPPLEIPGDQNRNGRIKRQQGTSPHRDQLGAPYRRQKPAKLARPAAPHAPHLETTDLAPARRLARTSARKHQVIAGQPPWPSKPPSRRAIKLICNSRLIGAAQPGAPAQAATPRTTTRPTADRTQLPKPPPPKSVEDAKRQYFAAIDPGCAAVRVNPGNIKEFDGRVKGVAKAAGAGASPSASASTPARSTSASWRSR